MNTILAHRRLRKTGIALGVLSCALFSVSAFADSLSGTDDQYYYVFTGVISNSADGIHYPTADAACRVDYGIMEAYLAGAGYTQPTAYAAPYIYYQADNPPAQDWECDATATAPATAVVSATTTTINDSVTRQGDDCTSQQTYNPETYQCESPDDDQDRKEDGNPATPLLGGVPTCGGDPINFASGNEFESETDYQDGDGELLFNRYYNSSTGKWTTSYGTWLSISSSAVVLNFEDGRSSIFGLSNGVATPEPTELGSLTQVNGQWVYTSPGNVRFTFNPQGRLVAYQPANGLTQTISQVFNSTNYSTTVTVTDSRGHVLTYVVSMYGLVTQMTAADLTVTYGWEVATPPLYINQLVTVLSTRAGVTSTRSYAYNNPTNPEWLTGITDERGVVYANWTYDSQGRALTSQHAGGADLTTVAYNSDGTTTMTNALGHSVTYTFQTIQGVKRITSIAGQPTATCPAANSSYTYTTRGQVQTKTDALGNVTAYTYDTLGRLQTQVDAQGTPQARTTTMKWDTTWPYLLDTMTTADRTITYGYDSQGRLLSTTAHDNKE